MPKEKIRRKPTVMQDLETIKAVCLAELGKNNTYCREKFGIDLSDGQFQYRLTKAKTAAGYEKGDGFRKAWREGRSNYEEIVKACMPGLQDDYEKSILPRIQRAPVQVKVVTPVRVKVEKKAA